jgi:hypothetical protein
LFTKWWQNIPAIVANLPLFSKKGEDKAETRSDFSEIVKKQLTPDTAHDSFFLG